jgi:hypothetical protein
VTHGVLLDQMSKGVPMMFGRGHAPERASSRGAVARVRALRGVSLAVSLVLGAMVLGAVPMGGQAAAPAAKTTFTFTGALSGTWSQANNPCDEVGHSGGMFQFDQNKLKGSSDTQWTVSVNALKAKAQGGTYKSLTGLTGNGASIVFEGTNGKQAVYWASKSGTLTTSPTGGSLSVNLVPDTSTFVGKPGKGDIKITGSWGCEAS